MCIIIQLQLETTYCEPIHMDLKCTHYKQIRLTVAWLAEQNIIMVALWNRADHYTLSCGFLFFFSSPNLIRRRLDVCHTCTHDVALVRI